MKQSRLMKKIKDKLIIGALLGGCLGTAYMGVPSMIELVKDINSQEIGGAEISRVIKEEADKLRLDYKKLQISDWNEDGIFVLGSFAKESLASSRSIGNSRYELQFRGNETNRTTIRHELYHIADGHCDAKPNILNYFLLYEPQAAIYSTTGLKL